MKNQYSNIKTIAYKYGIYSAITSIAGLMIIYLMGIEGHWLLSVASTIITIIIYYYGINEFKKVNSNPLTLKTGLKTGMGIALVGGIVTGLYSAMHYWLIQPEFLEQKRKEALNIMMAQNPSIESEQLELSTKLIHATTSEFFVATMMILGCLFFGFIISLIISVILKE